MALGTIFSEVEEEKNTSIIDAAIPENTNLSTLGTPGLKIVISLSLITQQRKVMIGYWHWLVYAHWEFCFKLNAQFLCVIVINPINPITILLLLGSWFMNEIWRKI